MKNTYLPFCDYKTLSGVLLLVLIAGCSTVDVAPIDIDSTPTEDGAPAIERNVDEIPDAIPQMVTRTRAGNKSPYTVFNKTYTLLPKSTGYQEKGYASWYGTKFHGRNTANGEVYDMWGMTAAHKTLPIPSYVEVTNLHNNRSIIVRINDRGPFHSDRIIDLSYAAAKKLGFAASGVALVNVEDVTPVPLGDVGVTASPTIEPPKVISIQGTEVGRAVAETKPVPQISEPTPRLVRIDAIAPTTLQVGAFKEKASANKLRQKLAGLLRAPVTITPAQNQWFRVRVGPITDKQMMSETRQILSEQGIKKPYTVK